MRRFAITLMAVTMAFTASARALAPTSGGGAYNLSTSVTYRQLGDGTWEYGYDLYRENPGYDVYLYDYLFIQFDFGDGGTVSDHVLNMYDTGSRLEHREFWTVQGITYNHAGKGWYGEIRTGVQASFGDSDTDTWITNPTAEQANYNAWFFDPDYAAAEGMANPFHAPSDYARQASNPYHVAGTPDAGFGLHAGIQGDQPGATGSPYTPSSEAIFYDMEWYFGSHLFGGASAGPQLLATFRIVSDLGPYGETFFQSIGSGLAPTDPILGPGVGAPPLAGDFDGDGDVDADDINDLCANITGSGNPANDPKYDLDGDGDTDQADMDEMIHELVEITGGDGTGTEYGDFDLDGDIDTTDLTILATNFGVGTTWSEGNANCDLVIDTTDLTILATNFGFVASGAVPEPMTLCLMGCGAIGLLRRRRRRRPKARRGGSKIRRGGRA